MRTWFWTLLLLALAVALAVVLREHGGNVLILAPPWRVELSLTLAVLLLLALFLIAHVALRIAYWLSDSPGRFRSWRGQRAQKRDTELLESGWIAVLEGRYEQAQKDLSRLLARNTPAQRKVLAALMLARAQHLDGRHDLRDQSLEQATAAADTPRLKEAASIVAAELWLEQGRAQEALALLQPMQDASARDANAMRLLLKAHQQLGNQDQVYELTRLLLRRGVLEKPQALALIESSASARLATAGADGYKAIWGDLKANEKVLPAITLEAAMIQTAQGNIAEASKLLEAGIEASLDARLLAAYSRCPPEHVARRLNKAEVWLKAHPDDPDLLAALGNLCLTGQLWGQGERYLQRSMQLRSDARVHALLGNLYDRLARPQDAARHWRLASGAAGALPVLAADSVLPAADTRHDPSLRDIDGVAEAVPSVMPLETHPATGMPLPVPASVDVLLAGPASSALRDPQSGDLHDYFDSAPIPGVDVTQTSDQPYSGARHS